MLASAAALRRSARLWRQATHGIEADLALDVEQGPPTLAPGAADSYEDLRSLVARIAGETLHLYDQAASLALEYADSEDPEIRMP